MTLKNMLPGTIYVTKRLTDTFNYTSNENEFADLTWCENQLGPNFNDNMLVTILSTPSKLFSRGWICVLGPSGICIIAQEDLSEAIIQ